MLRDIENFEKRLAWLKELPKVLVNPKAQWINKKGHFQKSYIAKAESETGENELEFHIYMRQSIKVSDDYSCGISIHGEKMARYNGSSHIHRNTQCDEYPAAVPIIERGTCHIHKATQFAMTKRNIEHYADPTERYDNVGDALVCLLSDYNVTGLGSVNQRRLL